MKNLLNNKFLAFLSFLSLISIVYIIYSAKNTSVKPAISVTPTPTPISNIKSDQIAYQKLSQSQILFDSKLNFDSFPKTIKIYNATQVNENLNSLVQNFVNNYKLFESSNIPNYWVSSDKNYRLSVNYDAQYFTLDQNFKSTLYSQYYSLNQAKTAAENIIQQFFGNYKLELDTESIKYSRAIKGHTEWGETTPANANLIGLKYRQTIDNLPYYSNNNVNPPLTLTIGAGDNLYSLMYISQPIPTLSNPVDKKLISLERAQQLLEEGQGEILSMNYMDINPKTNYLPPLIVTKVNLEYRYDPTKLMVIPYFRLTATFQSEYLYEALPVTLILPAVEL